MAKNHCYIQQSPGCYEDEDSTSSSRGSVGRRATKNYAQPFSTSTTTAQEDKQNKPNHCKSFVQTLPPGVGKIEQNAHPDLLFPSTKVYRSVSTFSDWFAWLLSDSVAAATGAAVPSFPPDVAVLAL